MLYITFRWLSNALLLKSTLEMLEVMSLAVDNDGTIYSGLKNGELLMHKQVQPECRAEFNSGLKI